MEVPDWWKAVARVLGRLGGDQKNQEIIRKLAFLDSPRTPLFGAAHAEYLHRFEKACFTRWTSGRELLIISLHFKPLPDVLRRLGGDQKNQEII